MGGRKLTHFLFLWKDLKMKTEIIEMIWNMLAPDWMKDDPSLRMRYFKCEEQLDMFDFSAAKKTLKAYKQASKKRLKQYIAEHPEYVLTDYSVLSSNTIISVQPDILCFKAEAMQHFENFNTIYAFKEHISDPFIYLLEAAFHVCSGSAIAFSLTASVDFNTQEQLRLYAGCKEMQLYNEYFLKHKYAPSELIVHKYNTSHSLFNISDEQYEMWLAEMTICVQEYFKKKTKTITRYSIEHETDGLNIKD